MAFIGWSGAAGSLNRDFLRKFEQGFSANSQAALAKHQAKRVDLGGSGMAGAPKTVIKKALRNAEQAPFIYFDGVASYGVNSGAIQIELAADVILPEEPDPKTDVVMTAHLRCTPAAAMALQQALNKIFEVLNMPTAVVNQLVGRPN